MTQWIVVSTLLVLLLAFVVVYALVTHRPVAVAICGHEMVPVDKWPNGPKCTRNSFHLGCHSCLHHKMMYWWQHDTK